MNGAGKKLWGYYPTTDKWIPLQVDINGKVIVDMSAIGLTDLSDVDIAAVAAGNYLRYNAATGMWENETEADIAGILAALTSLGDLADVRVPAPADQNFLYWDDAAGEWTYRILVDADIPAGIARDAEVATAVSDHAALTTGIHGVGARFVAETSVEDLDLAAHKTRHQRGGADEIDVAYLILYWLKSWLHLDWLNPAYWTDHTSGSGNFALSPHVGQCKTGIVLNSEACKYISTFHYFAFANPLRRWRLILDIYVTGSLAGFETWIGWMTDPTAPAANTSHLAWFIQNGNIYASCGSVPNFTQEDTGVDVVLGTYYNLKIITTATEAKFYIDEVLKKTLTTNLPDGKSIKLLFYIKTTDTNESILGNGLPNVFCSPV